MMDEIHLETPGGNSVIKFAPVSELTGLVDSDKTIIVADEFTKDFIPEGLQDCPLALVKKRDEGKTPEQLFSLWEQFLEYHIGRDWSLVGIGGGAVSDIAGFAAATWQRGIDFGFVPSTLLAMVDASIGGKNAINIGGQKNQAGTIKQPRFVLIDTGLLESLPEEAMAEGFAEMIKHGILDGPEHLNIVKDAIAEPEAGPEAEALKKAIRASVAYKASVVMEDANEIGPRRLLNLGHSFGHGIEAATGLPHGHSVSAGIMAALRLAVEMGGDEALLRETSGMVKGLGLPVSFDEARIHPAGKRALERPEFNSAVIDAMVNDKKRQDGRLFFVLPMGLGKSRIEAIPIEKLLEFLRRAP